MKTGLKIIVQLISAVVFALVFGSSIATYFNSGVLVPFVCILIYSIIAPKRSTNILSEGVYVEVWLKEFVERFRFKREWLSRIPRYDDKVGNKVIHLVDIGADPNVFLNVLIDENNPIPTNTRVDADIPISLDKYDTENTRISSDELRAIAYDKMAVTLNLHMNSISDKAALRAAWRLAAADQPHIKTTTGLSDGRAVPKKSLTPDDLVMMSEMVCTPANEGGPDWPEGDGICVMDYRHVADMQRLDQNFDKQWRNAQTGELFPYNGWQIMKFNQNPKYQKQEDGTFALKAFGAANDPANDLHSSLFFLPQRAFAAADAEPLMVYGEAKNRPATRDNVIGFTHWSIITKKKADGFYQLVSDKI